MTARTGDLRWLFLSLPFSAGLLLAARLAPTGYRLGPDGVVVERRARPVVLRYATITGIDRAPRQVKGLTAFGSSGIFGRFGTFWNMRLGVYRLYLSRADDVVWLATRHGWIGLSPDRPDDFARALAARLGLAWTAPEPPESSSDASAHDSPGPAPAGPGAPDAA